MQSGNESSLKYREKIEQQIINLERMILQECKNYIQGASSTEVFDSNLRDLVNKAIAYKHALCLLEEELLKDK